MSSMSYIDEGNNCATIVRLIAATAFALATTTPRPTQGLPQLPNQGSALAPRRGTLTAPSTSDIDGAATARSKNPEEV